MKALVGLGNPGARYANTRHNAGYAVIDELARRSGSPSWRRRFEAEVTEIPVAGQSVLLIKPLTYMNGSGASVQAAMTFYKLPPEDVLVLVDDIHLALGDLRLRPSGSAGGHNGLKDIEARIGQGYPRLRLGVGAPAEGREQIDWVLSRFAENELADVNAMTVKAADCCQGWLRDGVVIACQFNGPLRPPPPRPKRPPAVPNPPATIPPVVSGQGGAEPAGATPSGPGDPI